MAFNAPGEDINPDQETTITPEVNPVGSSNGSLSGYFSKMDAANDVALSLDNAQDFEQQKDVTALNLSAKDNPIQTRDQASKILKLEMDTGLPTEFINDNLAEVEKEAKAGAFDIEHFRQTSPKFAQFVASHPAHLPLFGDSLKQFQEIENQTRFGDGVDEASLMAKKSQFISKRFDGVQTPADIKAEAELDKQLSQLEFLKEGRSFSDMVSSSMGYTVRQTGDSLEAAAKGAFVGTVVGAYAAPFTAGASVPIMAATGAKFGALSATALQAYEMETNFAYDEIRQVPGIDNESAKNVARAVGAVNAAIETGAQLFAVRRLPYADKLFNFVEGKIRKNATTLATKALARETTREAVLTSAKKVAQIGGSEYAEEFVQSLVGAAGKEIASSMNDVDSGQTFWGAASNANEEGKQALFGSVGTFGLLHGSANLYKHIENVKQGDKNAQMFDAIAGGVQSEAFKALPDKGQEALKAILSDSGAQTTYFQSDEWDAYWKAKGQDPREIAVQVAQDGGASYDQAFDSTGFIAIPTERVGRKLLHNNEHKELLMDATTDVTKATPREAMKAQEEMQKEIEAAKADQKKTEVQSTNALEDKTYEALTKARVPGDARVQAKLFAKIAGTLSKSEGKTAEDLVAPYALEISRIMSERVRQQSIDSLDPILDKLRTGVVPEESTARGESLVSFLKNKGGISLEGLGGDVAAMEPDKKRQTYKRLSQKKGGIDFDKAVEIAHESGYLQNRDSTELLDAIAKELAGDPVYSPQFENANALENIRVTNEYIRHMKSLGIDLSKMDNETVKKILAENKAQTPVDQGERDDIFLQSNLPKTIKIDGVNRPTTNSEGKQIGRTKKEVQNFYKWFGDSKVVDDQGRPLVVYHGTTGDFTTFEKEKANPESDMGAGFYFTNNQDDVGNNYSGLGPDLTGKIEREAERIAAETDREYNDPEVIKEAKDKYMVHEGVTIPSYLTFKNPLIIGGDKETQFTYEKKYNEETDEYEEPSGSLIEFIEALRGVSSEFSDGSTDGAISEIFQEAADNGEIGANKLFQLLKSNEEFGYYTDDSGNLISSEIIRKAFESSGFDGVIDETVNEKFGSERKQGKSMEGMDYGTVHYIAFNPTDIKSAIGNSGSFDKNNPNILFQGKAQPNDLGFYSRMIRTIEEKMGTSASVEQVNGMLKEIKPEERKWLGLDEFLKGKTKVNKEELLQHLRANDLQVKEITKGSDEANTQKLSEDLDKKTQAMRQQKQLIIDELVVRGMDEVDAISDLEYVADSNLMPLGVDDQNIVDKASRRIKLFIPKVDFSPLIQATIEFENARLKYEDALTKERQSESTTKFGSYQLPGGENYREVLFTLPDSKQIEKSKELLDVEAKLDAINESDEISFPTSQEARLKALDERSALQKQWQVLNADYLTQYNASKKEAYKSSHFEEKNILAHTRLNDRIDADGKKVLFVEEIQSDWHQAGRKSGYKEEFEAKIKEFEDFLKSKGEYREDIDMSYARLEAAGASQEMLGNFEKVMKSINGRPVPDAPFKKTWHEFVLKRIIRMASEQGYDKIAWTTGEQQADRYDLSKQIDRLILSKSNSGDLSLIAYSNSGSQVINQKINDESELEDYIGKEAGKKLIEAEWGEVQPNGVQDKTLANADLKVGGEGMKGFYDKILVDFANKFGKKYGAKVENTEVSAKDKFSNNNRDIDQYRVVGADGDIKATNDNLEQALKNSESFPGSRILKPGELINPNKKEGVSVHSLEITPQLKDAALNEGFTLFQKKDTGPLGQLRIGTNRKMNIDLYAKADFSTFAHEQAHFWLEVMGDLAASPEGSDRVKQMYADALEYLGVKDRSEIKREHHEKFAESFEKFLMEGKAPTPALQRLFNTFRAWLEFVYSGLRQLDVKISPQIRSVFDRMLATDEEIAAAQKEQSFEKLILDPIAAGLTDEQLEKYSKLHEEAKQEATNNLLVKVMKQMQKERTSAWKDEQAEVKAQVTRAVDERADITLIKMLKAGKLEGRGDMPVKLDRKIMVDAYGKEFVDRLPRGIFGKDGMGHEELAALLGFESGWDMVEMIANTPDRVELIDQMTNDEMVSRHGDQDVYLNGTLQEAAMEAIHSDKQAELMRMEYDFLQQQKTKETKDLVKSIARRAPTVQQVRLKAEEIIAQESVGSLMPYQYLRAEKKHANNAIDFLQKGDIDNALDSKKKELLNHELYRAATLAKENVVKIEGRLNKFFQEDSKIGKNRDMQLIGAGRAILSGYGFGTNPKTPDQHLEQMKKYDPDGYAVLIDRVNAALENADFYKNLTYEKFLALNDVLDGIWQQSKSSMLIKVEGQKLLQRDAIDTLLMAVGKLPANSVKINESTQSPGQARLQGLLSKVATLKRVEAKLGVMDEYTDGEFKKYFFNSVREATELYRAKKGDLIRRFNALVQANKENFGGKQIVASSLNFTFKNKGELLAAMLHTGNESNFKKLILGNGWGELREDKTLDSLKWDAFIEDSHMTGILTKADYDFVQGVWDLFESFKADAQAAHYEMNGFYFGEIVGKPIKTPWGEYKGGYVPATPDNTRSKESAIRNEKYQIEDNFARELPPKVDGFTKNRVENFSTPLLMDLTAIPFQIDRTIRYTYITPRVKEVLKLVHNRELRAALDGYDPHFVDQILVPFLSRATTQTTVIHTDSKFSDQFYSFAKNNAAIQIMFANIPNIVQQTANFIPAALRAGPGFLFNAVKNSILHNKELTQAVTEKSLFMRNQLERSDEKARFETEKVLEDLNKFESANEWVRSNAYIGQIYLQNIMNIQVWMASYDQAQANGMAEDESVRYADSAVRETQSSMAAEDTAAIETDKPIMKALMMFYGFFNNMGNLYASEWTKASQQPGSKALAKKAMIAANFGLFAFAGQIIVDGLRGHIGEDDDDKETLEFWLKYYFGASFSLVAPMAGVFGQLAQVGVKNLTNTNSYGNRVSVSPLISGPEQIIGTIAKVAAGKEVGDKEKVKGAMSLMGMVPLMGFVPVGAIPGVSVKVADKVASLTRLSGSAAVLGALKKPVGYAVGVQEGKDKADNSTDIMNGIMSGSAK